MKKKYLIIGFCLCFTFYHSQTINDSLTQKNKIINLAEVIISDSKNNSQGSEIISQIDQQLRPTNSAQDLLSLVPGLFIAQHAGGGKAEQIFFARI